MNPMTDPDLVREIQQEQRIHALENELSGIKACRIQNQVNLERLEALNTVLERQVNLFTAAVLNRTDNHLSASLKKAVEAVVLLHDEKEEWKEVAFLLAALVTGSTVMTQDEVLAKYNALVEKEQ